MNADQEKSRSVWLDQPLVRAGPLRANLRTDVLVIGGGITGLSTAYELAAAGRDVVVVDRGAIGGGMTARTSGHLSYEIDDTYAEAIETLGERAARQYLESQKAAIDRIEQICQDERITCDFARIELFLFAPDNKGRKRLERELEALDRLGMGGVAWGDAPVSGDVRGCLRFPDQARFQPLAYLSGLARAIKRRGGTLYANTAIVSVEETKRGVIAKTEKGQTIRARAVVAATNSPFVNRSAIHNKQAPYRSYVISLEMPRPMTFDALLWDTEDPYHYVRAYRTKDASLLIVGGEDHKTGEEDDVQKRLERLEAWARNRFAGLGKRRHAWSGQVYEPVDYAPFIGRSPGHKNVFLVTGDSGEGLTTGVAASLILPDLIAGRKNRWSQVYRPSRKPPAPSPIVSYAKDLAGAARHLVERFTEKETAPKDIGRGSGAITNQAGTKVATFRDPQGKLHNRSAACTHAGCVVHWNSFERCWDCPCHGSHFAPTGEALQCPAVTGLPALRKATRSKQRKAH